jgi:hypothetical protein
MKFVILEHFLPTLDRPDHYDLMFLLPSGLLRTWSVRRRPDSSGRLEALSLADHRPAYLTYQGPTKHGGGWVRRWTRGRFRTLVQQDRCWRMIVESPLLGGVVTLEQADDGSPWRYTFQRRTGSADLG